MEIIKIHRRTLPRRKFYTNRLHSINAIVYVIIVYCFAVLATHYSYVLERDAVLHQNREATNEIHRYYENKQVQFWTVFVPAFQRTDYYQAVFQFMKTNSGEELMDPIIRGRLVEMMNSVASRDPDISFILLYRKQDTHGYIFNPYTKIISETSSDFPYLSELKEKKTIRRIFGVRTIKMNEKNITVYGIAGDAYTQSLGSLLAGYNPESIDEIYKRYAFRVPTQILITTLDGEVVYDSSNKYSSEIYNELPLKNANGRIKDRTGKEYYVETIMETNHNYMVSCIVNWQELNQTANKNSWAILGTCTLFALMSAVLYIFTGHRISRRVGIIIEGLKQIGKHNLRYRIPLDNSVDEFSLIASHINNMNMEMESNIQKLYIYQLRQKTAELGELQSKFNPHFLYNTLEVIRAQIQEDGNNQAGEMIMLLARIFRSFIAGKPFVAIQEEIAFCNTYLELFRLRYRDRIRIEFDMETSVMGYGIIRNLLQPIIENYFIHGFDPSKQENLITISGRLEDEAIVLTIADNGLGIPPDHLERILGELNGESQFMNISYGLKNINDRIRIFYGPAYGISIQSALGLGTVITMRIKKMSCEEHKSHMETDL